jgi:hypothetical protein
MGGALSGVAWLGPAGRGGARQGFYQRFSQFSNSGWTKIGNATNRSPPNREREETMAIDRNIRIGIGIEGIGIGIMFDRYPGDNQTKLPTDEKMYLKSGTKELVYPAVNIMSYLTAQNTPSAPKKLFPSKEYKKIAGALASFAWIEEDLVPFTRGGQQVVFGGFNNSGEDVLGHIIKHSAVARLDKGIPNPKERPLLLNEPAPWQLDFHLQVLKNEDLSIEHVKRLFYTGGMAVAFGTYRPQFGKFKVARWDIEQVGE